MLKIRLARWWRKKAAFFRIVLTEHTKPVKSGYKEVLGWYNPLTHESKFDVEAIKERIGKGAQPSNRVAKIVFKSTEDAFFEKYITLATKNRKKKNAPDEPEETEAPAAAEQATPTPEETPAE